MFKFQWLICVLISFGVTSPAISQIVPDNTLGEERTLVDRSSGIFSIEGGSVRGTNIFHSFEEFNIRQGEQVYFRTSGEDLIFSRVTGSNASQIDGVLGVEGQADIFFMNPNGIIFNSNSQLDVNGNFYATTASSLIFENFEFSAHEPNSVPSLLTIRGDVGFRFQLPSSNILVNGSGHNLQIIGERSFDPFTNNGDNGISVLEGNKLFLLGGNIDLNGGVLTAPSGNILLAAVHQGDFSLGQRISENQSLGEISINDLSLIDTLSGGSSTLIGRDITLSSGSHIINHNFSSLESGDVNIYADNSIRLLGNSFFKAEQDPLRATSGISSHSLTQSGGDIFISSPNIDISDGGYVSSIAYGNANGGNISIESGRLELDGLVIFPGDIIVPSNIQTASLANGNSGDLLIRSKGFIEISDGAVINTNAFSIAPFFRSRAGDIKISSPRLTLRGRSPDLEFSSSILSSAFTQGDSGEIDLSVRDLEVLGGATIASVVTGSGTVSRVNIEAENVVVSGVSPGYQNIGFPSELSSLGSAISEEQALEQFNRSNIGTVFSPLESSNVEFQPSSDPLSSPGDVIIKARDISILDGGMISAVNISSVDTGDIFVSAERLTLERGAIAANMVAIGAGGNIFADVGDLFVLDRSVISGSVLDSSTGGQVQVSATNSVIVDSIFSSNSVFGEGGNIELDTQVLVSSNSIFEANSESSSSLNGQVRINILNPLQIKESDISAIYFPSTNLLKACSSASSQENSLSINRTHGDSSNFSYSEISWMPDIDFLVDTYSLENSKVTRNLEEASFWEVNEMGEIVLNSHYSNYYNMYSC